MNGMKEKPNSNNIPAKTLNRVEAQKCWQSLCSHFHNVRMCITLSESTENKIRSHFFFVFRLQLKARERLEWCEKAALTPFTGFSLSLSHTQHVFLCLFERARNVFTVQYAIDEILCCKKFTLHFLMAVNRK